MHPTAAHLLDVITAAPDISARELSDAVRFKSDQVRRHLRSLVAAGLIEHAKGGRYRVTPAKAPAGAPLSRLMAER